MIKSTMPDGDMPVSAAHRGDEAQNGCEYKVTQTPHKVDERGDEAAKGPQTCKTNRRLTQKVPHISGAVPVHFSIHHVADIDGELSRKEKIELQDRVQDCLDRLCEFEEREKTCEYRQRDFGGRAWTCSSCGWTWTFFDGSPSENDMSFCPFCGAQITAEIEVQYNGDEEDEEDDSG